MILRKWSVSDLDGHLKEMPSAGARLSVIAFYGDALPNGGGYAPFGLALDAVEVSP